MAGEVNGVIVAGTEFGEQSRARCLAAADRRDAGAVEAREHLGDAFAFLDRARQVTGRIDDQQHVEAALAAALLAPLGDGHALGRITATQPGCGGRRPAIDAECLPGPMRARAVVHDDERRRFYRRQRRDDFLWQQQFRQPFAEILQFRNRHAGCESRVFALEGTQVEPPGCGQSGRLRRGAE